MKAPSNIDDAIAEANEELGFDLAQFREMLIFVEQGSAGLPTDLGSLREGLDGDKTLGGVVLSGTFDPADLAAALAEGSAKVPAPYKGVEMFADEDEAIAIVGGHVVTGSRSLVQSVIDVAVGDAPPLAGGLRDSFGSLGPALIKGVVNVPEGSLDEALGDDGQGQGLPGFNIDLGLFASIQEVSFSADVQGAFLVADLRLGYPDEAAAMEAADFLDSITTLLGGFFGTPELRELLDGIEITVEGNAVAIDVMVLPSALQGLDSLGDPTGGSVLS